MRKTRIKNSAGMTLVEVIVAVAILLIVTAPLFTTFSQGLKMERRTAIHALITYEAQMKMEEAYGMPAADLMSEYNASGTYTIGDPADSIELYYEYETTVVNYSGLDFYQVTITIGNEYYVVDTTLDAVIDAK